MTQLISKPEAVLSTEARYLDDGDFDSWLALYTPDCLFWMPARRESGELTEDPESELSLIYYRGRRNLEDRIQRIRSRHSVASSMMQRVSHMIGNVLVTQSSSTSMQLISAFTVHVYDVRMDRAHVYFGDYRHHLVHEERGWKIAEKIIHLKNDVIPTMLDVYSI